MKPVAFSFILWLSFLSTAHAQYLPDWTWGGPIDPLQEKVAIQHYELNLELVAEEQWIEGFVKVTFECKEQLDTLQLNLIGSYEVTGVELFDKPAEFRHFGDTLDVYIPHGCSG